MDSPESTKLSAGDATETVPGQDSPIFSYISNLSPIQLVNEPGVSQGFTVPNSPPIVFRSPTLNPQSQSSLLKRSGFPPFPTAKLSGREGSFRVTLAPANRSRKLDAEQGSGLKTYMEKSLDGFRPVDNQTESPLGCADRFFADVYTDSFNSSVSAESSLKYSDNIDQPPVGMTNSEESARILECNQNARENAQSTAVAPSAITNRTEEVRIRDASVDKIAIEADMMPEDGDIRADQGVNLEPSFPENLAPSNKHPGNFVTENAEAGQTSHVDDFNYLLSRSAPTYEGNENSSETAGALSGIVPDGVQSNSMAAQHRGLLVRCLQFDDVLKTLITDNRAQNPSGIENSSRPLFSVDREGPKSLSLETPQTPIGQTVMTQYMVYPRNTGNSSMKVPMPLGIGLHLNSIVSTMQVGAGETITVKSSDKGNFTTLDEQVTPLSFHVSENSKNSSYFPLPESVLGTASDGRHDNHALVVTSSNNSFSSCDTRHLENSVVYNPIKGHSTPAFKGKSSTGNAADEVEFNKPSPKKKRKKASESSGDNSCQRCNCKKSKCLKLYCDCFAAGIYCAEPCSCQGCFNRPDYEDTVLETRKQIESRNPLAFAPKIVQKLVEPPSSIYREDETQLSKSSGRHKRGCNCKKSMCHKKYCECYQAKVGCSDGCRCEGCKNAYGQKGEHAMNKDVGMQCTSETTDGSFAEALEMVGSGNALYHTELCSPHHLTPLTPSFEYSDQGKGASKAWFPSERVCFDHEIDYHKTGAVSDFSSDYHGHGNMKPLDDQLNAQQWENNLQIQPFSGSGQFPPASSLRWRGSPTTPMAQFTGTKLTQPVAFYDDVHNIMEDDTPDILKETPNTPNAVKVSSPNKKRVSPPRSNLREQGSSSSAGLRIARKFILQAVPSFPPLTPCVESKNGEQEKT